MSYGKKLYKSNLTAFDAENVYDSTIGKLQNEINEDLKELTAAEYNSSGTYAVGAYCIYNDVLYRCTTPIASGEAWTAGHWAAVNTTNELSGKVSKAGDTMTGMLFQRSPNIDINQTQSAWGDNYLLLLDKNDARVAGVRAYQNNGFDGIQIAGHNGSTENALRLGTKSDGSRNVYVTDPAAWRSALETIKDANIAASDTTASANDYATAINSIITSVAPQNWAKGAYAGTFQKTNSGTQSAWTGQYILNVYNPGGNWATQGVVTVQGRIFNVWYRSGVWAISEMHRYDDYCYAANETSTFANAQVSGYVASDSKIIAFTIPVEKSMEKISTVTVTALSGVLRGVNGCVNNATSTTNWIPGYTVNAYKAAKNLVHIEIIRSTAFTNVTAQTPITASINLTLKFT